MKGLVLELRDGLAAVLREDGQVVTTAMACQVGETVELPAEVIPFAAGTKTKNARGRWIKSVAAAALALAVVGGGYSYNTAFACSYVSVDAADASIELAINRRGEVIDVRAADEESAQLAEELSGDLRRMPVDQALDLTMDRLEDRGFLDDSREPVVIGVTADNEKRAELLDAAVDHVKNEPGRAAQVYAVDVTPQERQDAARQQQTGGRFAFEKQNPAQTETPPAETQESSGPQGGQPGGAQETQQVPQIGTQNTTPAASSGAPDASGKPRAPGGSVRPAQTGSAGGVMPSGGSGEPAQPAGLPDQQEPPAAPAQETGSEPSGQPDGEAQHGGEGQPGDVPQPEGESQPSTEQTPPAGGEQSQQASPPDMGPDGQPSNQPGSEAQPGGESQPGGGSQTAAEQPGQGEPDRQPSAPASHLQADAPSGPSGDGAGRVN